MTTTDEINSQPKVAFNRVRELIYVVWLFILIASIVFWFITIRFASFPLLILAWVLFFKFGRKKLRPTVIAWSLFLLLTFSPVDIMPFPRGGPPRLVPLVMGLPRQETVERAKRGEVILGGCIVSGFEPKYYLVW